MTVKTTTKPSIMCNILFYQQYGKQKLDAPLILRLYLHVLDMHGCIGVSFCILCPPQMWFRVAASRVKKTLCRARNFKILSLVREGKVSRRFPFAQNSSFFHVPFFVYLSSCTVKACCDLVTCVFPLLKIQF